MKTHVAFGTLCLLAFVAAARADLDPETKKPYQLQVVLQVAANRVFTPLFHEQIQRDVQNQLRLSFGDLARIEVTREHPLLSEIESRGLDAAVDSLEGLADQVTHFVLVDYAAGAYQIQTRFHDGATGQTGPFAQRIKVNDRTAVASTVAGLIESSFSPVGTVTGSGKTVTLKLKGSELGVPLDRWVKAGNVFAVSRISKESGTQRGERLEWALLEVLDVADGSCRCRYWHRYQEDALTESAGTLGYRALRLPTSSGPIKVQLLDDTTLQPLDGVRVRVQTPAGGKPAELLTNRDGLAITREAFPHLALVQVLSGDMVRVVLPVERIEGRTAVARVKLQTDRESLAPLEARHGAWLRRIYENVRMSSERSAELSAQLNQSLEKALKSAQERWPPLEDEIKYLDREQEQLARLAKEKKLTLNLREGEQRIDELRQQAKALQAFIQRIESIPENEKSSGLHKLLERALLLEGEAEFDQAIRLYEQVLQASPEQSKVKTRLDKLKLGWETKGDQHKAARVFIYQTWPTLDVAGVHSQLDEAKKALVVCQANGDKLTPLKLLRVNAVHTVNLTKQMETLKRKDSEDNRNRAKTLLEISQSLLRLHNDAATWVGMRKD